MALDFGLEMYQSPEFTNTGAGEARLPSGEHDSGRVNYTGSYTPWFSSDLGQTAKLHLSVKISTIYKGGEWKPKDSTPILFEVDRSEVSWRPKTSGLPISSIHVEAGRTPFQDPLGIIASGLFDGLSGGAVLDQVRLSAGAFYTGLLYKETAGIIMTPSDEGTYNDRDSYFASRRLLFSAAAELPALTPRSSLAVNTLAQFDVNGKDTALHTQYLSAKYRFLALETLSLTGAAVTGLAENKGGNLSVHFAAIAGTDWEVPGALRDMLQGEIRWSNGAVNKNITAFAPLTNIAQGQVFDPYLSGLMTIKGKYTARFQKNFLASAEGTYFIRTDGETLIGAEYPSSSARALGGELYGTLSWAPASDLTATVGGGCFFPSMGNVFVSDAPIRWKIMVGLVLSL
jgi:hypothetical protein